MVKHTFKSQHRQTLKAKLSVYYRDSRDLDVDGANIEIFIDTCMCEPCSRRSKQPLAT